MFGEWALGPGLEKWRMSTRTSATLRRGIYSWGFSVPGQAVQASLLGTLFPNRPGPFWRISFFLYQSIEASALVVMCWRSHPLEQDLYTNGERFVTAIFIPAEVHMAER